MTCRECREEDRRAVFEGLKEYNSAYIRVRDLSYCIEEEGRVAAGILARLLEDCIYVEMLWVDEAFRRRGLGRRLLAQVEEEERNGAPGVSSWIHFRSRLLTTIQSWGFGSLHG